MGGLKEEETLSENKIDKSTSRPTRGHVVRDVEANRQKDTVFLIFMFSHLLVMKFLPASWGS